LVSPCIQAAAYPDAVGDCAAFSGALGDACHFQSLLKSNNFAVFEIMISYKNRII
jgi:hypothetical protein